MIFLANMHNWEEFKYWLMHMSRQQTEIEKEALHAQEMGSYWINMEEC